VTVRVVAAPWVLLGAPPRAPVRPGEAEGRAIPDGAVALEGDRVVAAAARAEVESRHGRAEALDAILLPALVNAHLHLEVSHLAGRVPGGEGLVPWIQGFMASRAAAPPEEIAPAMAAGARELVEAGVAAVGEVTNTLASLAPLAEAGLAGTLFLEVMGLTPERYGRTLADARQALAAATVPPGLRVALSPHAVYSTLPEAVAALLASGPASIHLAEDPAEREVTSRGEGPFALLARSVGSEPRAPRARSAIAAAAAHLRPGHLAVHCVDLDPEDVSALARSGATVVLCPRSNLHIGGRLPPLTALLEAGVPLAVGTDSRASTPSLAPLAELAVLHEAFPRVPAARLLSLAWNGESVGAPHVGRLAPGSAPGVLALPLDGAPPADPFEHLLSAGGAASPPRFTWLSRQRPSIQGARA